MKIFLSYSTLDKVLAGNLKHELEKYGPNVFLAHEDIEPSSEWIKKIIPELKTCHVFIPILTENYRGSKWTNQETGFAIAMKKVIIPIKINDDPHGFMSQNQALKLKGEDKKDITDTCVDILKVIAPYTNISTKIKNTMIKKFCESRGWMEAADFTSILFKIFDKFSERRVNKIIKCAINNDQIYSSWGYQGQLRTFVTKNKDRIAPELFSEFKKIYKQL